MDPQNLRVLEEIQQADPARIIHGALEEGERIVSCIEGLSHLAPLIRAEHEQWDGKGYPDGLSGEEIPLASRIVFVCDAYHAMISDRPYRKALDARSALEELRKNAGTQFCQRTIPVLLEAIEHTVR